MNYAAILKPSPAEKSAASPRYLKEGWVNLRHWKPAPKPPAEPDLDARLKAAAVALRRQWDQWNADHGVDYDYDRECSCSDGSSDDDADEGQDEGDALNEDHDLDKDDQYLKKTTLVNR